MRQRSPSDVRLRTAVQFSAVCMGGMLVASRFVRTTDNPRASLGIAYFAMALALGSVFSYWTLLAALAERRPALRDAVGRRVWAWAFFLWVAVGWIGWSVHTSQSLGAVMIVAASEFIFVSGVIGLTFVLFGRRNGTE
jgi:hypothetical protein